MSKLPPHKYFISFLRYFVVLTLSLIFPLLAFAPIATAQEKISRAYVIKAGFIYNFTRFIKWPPQSNFSERDNKYRICVMGDNPFGTILSRLEEKHRFKEKPLEIRLDVSQNDFRGCHILFISFSERFNIEQIVENLKDSPILTVGDTEGFTERGIDINLLVVENRVKMEINKQCLDNTEFNVSSELLDLADIVRGGECR